MKPQTESNNHTYTVQADQDIDITIYTDPLCCWSWAFQPQLEKLKEILGHRARWSYRMGGLIPSWDNFHDEVNSVTRPAQMGPVWMHAGQVANRPIQHIIWMKDPPASSYPACIAVKCAQHQSAAYGEILLGLLRESCMLEGKNIAKNTFISEAAEKLAKMEATFDISKFRIEFGSDIGLNLFREDLDLVRRYNINRFPTLIVRSAGKAIMIPGYRNYGEIVKAIQQIAAIDMPA